ncbi:MAG: hypothetical protein HY056_08885 [Proteobacteria bacterium]|nr:hypothetical protein [Pseudomonadota bacterium]
MPGGVGTHGGFLDGFRRDMAAASADGLDGESVAARLREWLRRDCERFSAPLANIEQWARNVEFEIVGSEYPRFTIECLGPAAFRFYPAVRNGEAITWLNIWVGEDLPAATMVERVQSEFNRRQ